MEFFSYHPVELFFLSRFVFFFFLAMFSFQFNLQSKCSPAVFYSFCLRYDNLVDVDCRAVAFPEGKLYVR